MGLNTAPASPSGRRLILSLGSVNIDIIAYSDALPRPGETIHAGRYAMGLGGKGANQAAAASRLAGPLGLTVELAGRTGDDAFGELARGHLAGFGVGLSALVRDPGQPTGIALIGVDAAGENAITVVGGANMALDATTRHRSARCWTTPPCCCFNWRRRSRSVWRPRVVPAPVVRS